MNNDGAITQSGGSISVGNLTQNDANLGNVSITGGTFTADRIQQNNLTISSGSMVIRHAATPNVISRFATLTLGTGGKLDINNNALIIAASLAGSWNGSAYDGVTGYVASGRNNGAWDGSAGIITSETNATTSSYTMIGVGSAEDVRHISGTQTSLWKGQVVSASDVLVAYTYGGDANLDGKLNVDDYIRIDSGIASGLSGWSNGDFNYDGKVNIDDYTTVIDANIGNQGPPFPESSGIDSAMSLAVMSSVSSATISSDASVMNGVSAVPEPSVHLAPLAGALFLRRRRNLRTKGGHS